jgi:hypothetical protein
MRLLRASLVISLAALGAAGCADQGGTSIIVLHHVAPADGCTFEAEGDEFRSAGIVDGAGVLDDGTAVFGYLAAPVVQNVSDTADGTLEAERTVILHGARVDLTINPRADNTEALDDATIAELNANNALRFTVPFSGSVTPGGGLTTFSFEAIPVITVRRIAEAIRDFEDRVLVTITYTVFGETTVGGSVESDPFTFPVTVCVGCVFQDLGPCAGLAEGTYAGGNSCNIYQDSVAQCCENSSGFLTCPAEPEQL